MASCQVLETRCDWRIAHQIASNVGTQPSSRSRWCGMKGDEGGRHGSVRVAGDVYRDEVYAASVRYVLPVSSRLRVMTILPRHVRVCMYCIRPV